MQFLHSIVFYFWVIVTCLIGLICVFVFYVWPKLKPKLEQRIKDEVCQRGPATLHVSLEVGDVRIKLGRKGHAGVQWAWDHEERYMLPHISFTAAAEMRMLKMGNPGEFLSPHLLTMEKVLLEVDLWVLVYSAFQTIEITRLRVRGAKLVYERNLHTSNVDALLAGMGSSDQEASKKKSPRKPEPAPSKPDGGQTCCKRRQDEPKPEGRHYNLRRIKVEGVSLEWATSLGEQMGVPGTELVLDDINFNNFTQEFGHQKASFIVRMLFMSLLKSTQKNIGNMGKHIGQNMEKFGHLIGSSVDKVTHDLGHNIQDLGKQTRNNVQKVGQTMTHGVEDAVHGVQHAFQGATGLVQKAAKDVNSTLNMTETAPSCTPRNEGAKGNAPPEKAKSWRCCDL